MLLAAAAESDSSVCFLSSSPLLQELIEVDSDVVFELASYILQVSEVIFLFYCSLYANVAFWQCLFSSAVYL